MFNKFDLTNGSVYLHLVSKNPTYSDHYPNKNLPIHIFAVLVDSKGTYDFYPMFTHEDSQDEISMEEIFNNFNEQMAQQLFNKFYLLAEDTSDLMVQ